MKRWITVLITVLLCFPQTVLANQPKAIPTVSANPVEVSAESAVVMEASTGTILYEKDKDKKLPPASVTKVMSLLLIFQHLDQGKLDLKDTVTVSEHAASMGGSQVFLEVGEEQDVKTLIKCVVISSANDAVVALAEHISGSEEAFVKEMNQEAKKLGMNHTTFKNACGLDAKGHVTTAYDIGLMSRELTTKHPDVLKYTKIWMDTFTHKTKKGTKEFTLSNTNKMIRQYEGCTGLKTGSTSTAKFCLSATATRNGVDLIAVVMASNDSKTRIKDASGLLNYGFSECQRIEDITTKKEIGNIYVEKGEKEKVPYRNKLDSSYILIKDSKDNIKKKIQRYKLTAPVKKGQVIGKIIYEKDGKVINQVLIKATSTVEKMDFLKSLEQVIGKYF